MGAGGTNDSVNIFERLFALLRPWRVQICCTVLAGLAFLFFYPGPAPKQSSLTARSAATTPRPVEVAAQLDKNALDKGETTRLRVSVFNRGNLPLQALQLNLNAPGFSWTRDDLACLPQKGDRHLTTRLLPAASTCTFEIPLTAAAASGVYAISANLDFEDTGHQTVALSLGPVAFDGLFGLTRWVRLGHRVEQVLKDLTLPLILLLLSFVFSDIQKDKETKDRDAQAERDAAQEVQKLLLERVMDLSQQYYLPIIRNAVLLRRELNRRPARPDRALYQALTLLNAFENLGKNKGGFFLKSIPAEYLIQRACILVRIALTEVLTEPQIEHALATPEWLANFPAFAAKIDDFKAAKDCMTKWLGADPATAFPSKAVDYTGTLDVIHVLLRYEINRPFWTHWYNTENDQRPLTWDFDEGTTVVQLPPWNQLTEAQRAAAMDIILGLKPHCGTPALSKDSPVDQPAI